MVLNSLRTIYSGFKHTHQTILMICTWLKPFFMFANFQNNSDLEINLVSHKTLASQILKV